MLQRVSDGSYITTQNPAHRGDILRLFATGVGPVSPAMKTNEGAQAGQMVQLPIIVGVNNGGVRVISSELLPGSIGVYDVTFQVPSDTTLGPYQNLGFGVVDSDNNLLYALGSFLPIQ